MSNDSKPKPYNLEERTFQFAKAMRVFIRVLPKTIANTEDSRQMVRASGSVGANYLEANDALGKKDFLMKIRTCLKESKETRYWLRLVSCPASKLSQPHKVDAAARREEKRPEAASTMAF